MAQKSIELILFRQLATYLAMPALIVDPDGSIIYCNEAAEKILGFKFSETGEIPANNWPTLFAPKDKDGKSISIEQSPLFITSNQYRLAHSTLHITTLQNELKHIELFTMPILNHMDIFLGSIAFFQEIEA